MAEVLGIGMPHAPMFQFLDRDMANILKRDLERGRIPARYRDTSNWPAPMREEWADDEGLAAAARHRSTVVAGLRKVRAELDAFNPDFILVFGDDQYENFREDVVPTFCAYFFDDMEVLPFRGSSAVGARENVWGQPEDKSILVRGHREGGVHLATELVRRGFDVAWAMKPHHHPTLGHSFMRTLVYLDYDQNGLDYPYMPFHVNSYGEDIARNIRLPNGDLLPQAPPAPTPARCFALGQAIGRILRASPYRVAVVGSSSWSHAFLTEKHDRLYPDLESDRLRLAELEQSRQRAWADLSLDQVRDAGQHELLNWICMAGVMGDATAEVVAYAETYIFNSTKVVALLR
jgi:hypothetical protein